MTQSPSSPRSQNTNEKHKINATHHPSGTPAEHEHPCRLSEGAILGCFFWSKSTEIYNGNNKTNTNIITNWPLNNNSKTQIKHYNHSKPEDTQAKQSHPPWPSEGFVLGRRFWRGQRLNALAEGTCSPCRLVGWTFGRGTVSNTLESPSTLGPTED